MTPPQPNGGFEWTQAPWGLALRCGPLLDVAPHLFTVGNLQLRSDEHEWNGLAAAMKVPADRLQLLHQVHGTGALVVRRGRPATRERPHADIAVSDDPESAMVVRVADCAPILIADTRQPVVAAVHAGWRGTLQGVAKEAVAGMAREFDSRPGDLVAAIGPCLGACCGEMGHEVVEQFRAAGFDHDSMGRWFTIGGKGRPYFDLRRANRDQLAQAGVPAGQIFSADLCTKTYADTFHSYRAHGAAAGRMIGVIRPRNRE